jgi:hypothetical protein
VILDFNRFGLWPREDYLMEMVKVTVELSKAAFERLNATGQAQTLLAQAINTAVDEAPPLTGEAAEISASANKLFP